MKNVLLVTDVNFWRQGAGHRMRIAALLDYLSSYVNITVAWLGRRPAGISNLLPAYLDGRFVALGQSRLTRSNLGHSLNEYLKNNAFDAIIIEYTHNSYLLDYISTPAKLILDTHDIVSERASAFWELGITYNDYDLTWEAEAEVFRRFDVVIGICEPDYLKIKSVMRERAVLCRHAVPATFRGTGKEVRNIGFVASEYIANLDAVSFFLDQCWPAISDGRDLTLSIYGKVGLSVDAGKYPNVKVRGYQEDLADVYNETDIIVNPVRFGAGLKIKNVEALANSVPLVTTAHGARGLEQLKGKALLTADSAPAFIGAVTGLIGNYNCRSDLAKNAYQYALDQLTPQQCYRALTELLMSVL